MFEHVVEALSTRALAAQTLPFDEARNAFRVRSNVVAAYPELEELLVDFYVHVYARCVVKGGTLPRSKALYEVRRILEHEFRRERGVMGAFNHAVDGTEGGVRGLLDRILEAMKNEAAEAYTRGVLDQFVKPVSWEDKVEFIRTMLAGCDSHFASALHRDEPERYAASYEEFTLTYVQFLRQTEAALRRY